MKYLLAVLMVVFSASNVSATPKTSVPVVIDGRIIPYKIFAVFLRPNQTFEVNFKDAISGGTVELEGFKGRVGAQKMQAPAKPGIYPMSIVNEASGEHTLINLFTLTPSEKVDKNGYLNGYRMGFYPKKPLNGLDIYLPPKGYVEVTQDNLDTQLSPHFRLKQFVSKQDQGYPKYLLLRSSLLLKLENILGRLNEEGHPVENFVIMSGYRTPWYNKAIGNVPYSRHVWGGASDVYIDENPVDGRMDDLNKDGRSDCADAIWLANFINKMSHNGEFGERDIDVQSDPVTVLGIGDMAGDVFGNGMLLSQSILLVAAFNHQHIFVDPNPDAAKSYVERQRLFALPRSSWSDFDASVISEGGGIFPRSAKSINITPAMQARFDISETQLAPDDLINRLLRSPVQLIWNGGIGTYVKASHETHTDAGDRANDHLRVDANQLRCVVIGEGGNLGLTQAARVEYCVNGGAMNTDFIDNSAGVDCSDHEVNIKIVLNDLVAREDITRKQRNKMLEAMTDEVAELVLSNNYRQAQSISIAQRFQHRHASEYQRLLSFLSQHAGLDRNLEFLPSDDVLAERQSAGLGLTRPELAVLLAYAKTHIKTQLIDSDVHLDDHIARRLVTCFPKALIAQFGQDLSEHRLAREIIATQMANEIVDSMGISFVASMSEAVGSSVSEVVRAYALVAECYKFDLWFEAIASTSSLSEAQKLLMRAEIVELGERATRWVLRNCDIRVPIETLVGEFAPVLSALEVDTESQSVTDPSRLAVMQNLRSAAMPSALAQGVEDPAALAQVLPLIEMARLNKCGVDELIRLNNEVGEHLKFEWLAQRLHEFQPSSHWQALQIDSLLDDLFRYQCLFSAMLLKSGDGEISNWQAQHAELLAGWNAALEEIRAVAKPDLALYALSIKRLEDICTKLDIGPRAST